LISIRTVCKILWRSFGDLSANFLGIKIKKNVLIAQSCSKIDEKLLELELTAFFQLTHPGELSNVIHVQVLSTSSRTKTMPPRKKLPILAAEISKNSIEQVSLSLQDLPEKPKDTYSLREAIALMHSSITTALSRGYKHEEISKLLANEGIKITASSLRRYLSITKPKGEGKVKRQVRKPRASAADAPAATPGKPGRKPKAVAADSPVRTAAKRGPKPATDKPKAGRKPATATTTRRRKST
jgi:hypothetical protein